MNFSVQACAVDDAVCTNENNLSFNVANPLGITVTAFVFVLIFPDVLLICTI